MGAMEIEQFLTHLAVNEHVAASTQNQALCAIAFLYKQLFKREPGELKELVWAKKAKRLPVVFTRGEAQAVLSQLTGMYRLMATLLYGAGLRLSECLELRVKDIDFSYKQITVRDGKGDKDRVTLLPESIIVPLQQHLIKVKKLHDKDLETGYGMVYLPDALAHPPDARLHPLGTLHRAPGADPGRAPRRERGGLLPGSRLLRNALRAAALRRDGSGASGGRVARAAKAE